MDDNEQTTAPSIGLEELEQLQAIEDSGKRLDIKHPGTGAVFGWVLVSYFGNGAYVRELTRQKDGWLAKSGKPRGKYDLIPKAKAEEIETRAACGTIAMYFGGFREVAGGPLLPNRADGTYDEHPPLMPNLDGKGKQIGLKVDMAKVHTENLKRVYGYREVQRQVDAFSMSQEEFLQADTETVAGN